MTQEPKHSSPQLIFKLIALLIPVLLFCMLEIVLRWMDIGYDYSLFHKPLDGVPGKMYLNPIRSYKYFGDLKGAVFFNGIGFLEEKPKEMYRVFVLGGSSAQGFPYGQQASFPSHLKRRLELLNPNESFEVVNLGASAINSHTLLDILPEVLDQNPDLILIYAGHNEYYGALGPGSTISVGSHPLMVKTTLFFRDFRVFQLIEKSMAKIIQTIPGGRQNVNLMEDMIGESSIPLGSAKYKDGIDQFTSNMDDILSMIKGSNTNVIIGTLSSNLKDLKPFTSSQLDENGYDADHYFEIGQEALDNHDSALVYFQTAKDLDGLRFRAPQLINSVIKSLAMQYKIPCVDVDFIFNDLSSGGVAGNELMSDHLHPNLNGYFELSKCYYQRMKKEGFGVMSSHEKTCNAKESTINLKLKKALPFSKLDSVQSQLTLAHLLGSYPFVPKGSENTLWQAIVKKDFVDSMGMVSNLDSARVIVAGEYWRRGNSFLFVKEVEVMLAQIELKEKGMESALKYFKEKKILEAVSSHVFQLLSSCKPSHSRTYMLAYLTWLNEDYDTSIPWLSQSIENRPWDIRLYKYRAYAYLMLEKYAEAVRDYSIVIEGGGIDIDAIYDRGIAHFEMKDYAGAISDFDIVIASNQNLDMAYFIRGYAKYGLKEKSMACEDWNTAALHGNKEALQLNSKFCN